MVLTTIIDSVKDALGVGRVYAEPYERDGVTVIVAAHVAGGGGGGGGSDDQGQQGEGGGFGVQGRPAGAYVIRDGDVRWQPAIDVNRLAACGALVLVVLVFARIRLTKLRLRNG